MKTKACYYYFFFRRSKLLSYDLHEIQISSFLSNWKVILSSENIEKVSVEFPNSVLEKINQREINYQNTLVYNINSYYH